MKRPAWKTPKLHKGHISNAHNWPRSRYQEEITKWCQEHVGVQFKDWSYVWFYGDHNGNRTYVSKPGYADPCHGVWFRDKDAATLFTLQFI